MEVYKYNKSREFFDRAMKVIPQGIYGHLGPSNGCFIPVDAYPFYVDKAKDSYIWDIDGNRFIDYMCAYGPIITGYNNKTVDDAARSQMELANVSILPSTKMVELAELLVDTVASADWAFFAKNGGDVTNFAVMTARAHTGRSKILKFNGGYHGVAQWMQGAGYAGVIEEDYKQVLSVPFNDIDAIKNAINTNKGEIACIIGTPYHHPAMSDNALPAEGFWKEVRQLCDENKIVLIIDDVRCGFRLDVKGSDYHYGFEADLICYCKALANGHNISALCGKNFIKNSCSSVFYTGSYWLSSVPMAAAIANIKLMREIDAAKICTEKGKKLTSGLVEVAKENGYNLLVTGEPSMWFMRITDDDSGILHQSWVAECVKRGVFFANHHNLFINTTLTDEDIKFTLEVADAAFKALKK
ncbi:MAG: glutamate-1-semialdehyde 2,1-aminomutase [Treponema sp.]|nr:MAG: glutamate-1-semialdehyde 2,1-aminomutase [Treponema sp.]